MSNLSAKQVSSIIESLNSKDFSAGAAAITGGIDTNDDRYEEIRKVLEKLISKVDTTSERLPNIIMQIGLIYDDHEANIPQLKDALNNFLTQYGIKSEGKAKNNIETYDEKMLEGLTDEQLSRKINEFKTSQQDLLARGKPLDKDVAKELKSLLQEQKARQGFETKKSLVEEESDPTPKAAQAKTKEKAVNSDVWFVLPSEDDMEKHTYVRVVCGSPSTEVLRDKYKKMYKLTEIKEVSDKTMVRLSAEEQYEAKKELERQRSFIEKYLDPSSLNDQNIVAHEISAKFLTDAYQNVKEISVKDNVMHYNFKNARIENVYDPETKQHTFTLKGNLLGRCAISLNRKEFESGRLISDAFDIIEYQDGQPAFYFYSSKGKSAIANETVTIVKFALKSTKGMTLNTPSPAEVGEGLRAEDAQAADAKAKEQVKAAETAAKTPEPAPKTAEPEPKTPEPTSEKAPEPAAAKAKTVKEEAPVAAEKAPATTQKLEEESGPASSLRDQLKDAIKNNYSKSTINYLIKQIADQEGKKSADIKAEFSIAGAETAKTPEPEKTEQPAETAAPVEEPEEAPKKETKKSKSKKKDVAEEVPEEAEEAPEEVEEPVEEPEEEAPVVEKKETKKAQSPAPISNDLEDRVMDAEQVALENMHEIQNLREEVIKLIDLNDTMYIIIEKHFGPIEQKDKTDKKSKTKKGKVASKDDVDMEKLHQQLQALRKKIKKEWDNRDSH